MVSRHFLWTAAVHSNIEAMKGIVEKWKWALVQFTCNMV